MQIMVFCIHNTAYEYTQDHSIRYHFHPRRVRCNFHPQMEIHNSKQSSPKENCQPNPRENLPLVEKHRSKGQASLEMPNQQLPQML